MSDLSNAYQAALALYQASGQQISEDELAVMTAIAGRESTWNPGAIQPGGYAGEAGVGVGEWQITPGTQDDLDLQQNAMDAWQKALGGESSSNDPYEAWNITSSGDSLIYSTATLPGGGTTGTVLPSPQDYQIGQEAASAVFTGKPPSNAVGVSYPGSPGSSSSKGGYDPLTAAMIQLNAAMHPSLSSIDALASLEIAPSVEMFLSRGLFALGFGILGALALFNVVTGGKVSGSDLPALVAGFIAGPEIGAATALSKLGLKQGRAGTSEQQTQLAQIRAGIGQGREARIEQFAPSREARAQQRLQLEIQRESRIQRQMSAADY